MSTATAGLPLRNAHAVGDAPWVAGVDPRRRRMTIGHAVLVGTTVALVLAVLRVAEATNSRGIANIILLAIVAAAVPVPLVRGWERRRATGPGMVWETDWTGRTDGFTGSVWNASSGRLHYFLAMATALAVTDGARISAWGLATAVLVHTLFAAHAAWRGSVDVSWESFPLRVGTRVRLHVATTPGSGRLEGAWLRLSCVETRRTSWMRAEHREIAYSYVDRALTAARAPGPEEFIAVPLHIPDGAPGTRVRGPTTVHWVLDVSGTLRGKPFRQSIPVPVAGGDGSQDGSRDDARADGREQAALERS